MMPSILKRHVNVRALIVVFVLAGFTLAVRYQCMTSKQPRDSEYRRRNLDVAVVCCGNRLQQTVVLIKSIALSAVSPVFLHLFVEDTLQTHLKSQIQLFPARYRARIQYRIYDIEYPLPTEAERTLWRRMFRVCATQRLFMPLILKHVDSLLYMDTDILVLSPLDPVFTALANFNTNHTVAMVPEQEPGVPGWYTYYKKHPVYGKQGLNSGVMLMNLTRLRAVPWIERLQIYYIKYKKQIGLGDQDLLNIYFHFHPDDIYTLTCEWNFRSDYCKLGNNACNRSESRGVRVLHGNRFIWHNHAMPIFRAVYTTVENHNMYEPLQPAFGDSMSKHLNTAAKCTCTILSDLFNKTARSLTDAYRTDSRNIQVDT